MPPRRMLIATGTIAVVALAAALPLWPRPGPASAAGVEAVSAGEDHTCAVATRGALKCWGHNLYGQLGDGAGWTPVDVAGLEPKPTPTCTPKDPDADTDGDTIQNSEDPNDDNDAYSDVRELGDDPGFSDQRNPHTFWDFVDVPPRAGLLRDGSVSALDIFGVMARF